jgi:hypothetical protein
MTTSPKSVHLTPSPCGWNCRMVAQLACRWSGFRACWLQRLGSERL